MPDAESFQYALLRAVPSLPRGEALNVGMVLYSPRHRFLEARTTIDPERLRRLDPDIDLDAVRAHLAQIEHGAAGVPSAGPIAGLDRSERFGWITSPRRLVPSRRRVVRRPLAGAARARDRLGNLARSTGTLRLRAP